MLTDRERDLYYAAGLFDGEGYIGWVKQNDAKRNQYSLRMSVGMTDLASVQLFADLFGGKIYFRKQRQPHHKPQWVWMITGSRSVKTYEELKPYLRLKNHI